MMPQRRLIFFSLTTCFVLTVLISSTLKAQTSKEEEKALNKAQESLATRHTQLIQEVPFVYVLHTPADYDESKTYPTVVILADSEAQANSPFLRKLSAGAKRQGFLVYRYFTPKTKKIKNPNSHFFQFLQKEKSINPNLLFVASMESQPNSISGLKNEKAIILLDTQCGPGKNLNRAFATWSKRKVYFLLNQNDGCQFKTQPNWFIQPHLLPPKTPWVNLEDFYQNTLIYNVLSYLRQNVEK